MKILGAILAGGQSRRFGSDKATALLHGQPLLDHVAEALRGQVDQLVVCGRTWPGVMSLQDMPVPQLGPLGGLCAALNFAHENGFDSVMSAGCDSLPVPDMRHLLQTAPAAIAGHQLFGAWPVALLPMLYDHLQTNADRSVRGWMAACGARLIVCDAKIYNLNAAADLIRYANTPEALR